MKFPKIKATGNTPIVLKKVENDQWELAEPFVCRVYTNEGVYVFKASKGFRTDLGSVPSRLSGFVDVGNDSEKALCSYLCHDIGYATNDLSRDLLDYFLKKMLKGNLEDPWDHLLAYYAVRLGGGKVYPKTDSEIAEAKKLASIRIDAK